jgi:hypothetical protein
MLIHFTGDANKTVSQENAQNKPIYEDISDDEGNNNGSHTDADIMVIDDNENNNDETPDIFYYGGPEHGRMRYPGGILNNLDLVNDELFALIDEHDENQFQIEQAFDRSIREVKLTIAGLDKRTIDIQETCKVAALFRAHDKPDDDDDKSQAVSLNPPASNQSVDMVQDPKVMSNQSEEDRAVTSHHAEALIGNMQSSSPPGEHNPTRTKLHPFIEGLLPSRAFNLKVRRFWYAKNEEPPSERYLERLAAECDLPVLSVRVSRPIHPNLHILTC